MRYQTISAAILASIASVLAQTPGFDAISVPTEGQIVKVGGYLDIKWEPNKVNGTVTIKLLEGADPKSLAYDPVIIASSVNNLDGLYKWQIPASVGSFATYGIAIILESDPNTFQWSFPFKIQAADADPKSNNGQYGGNYGGNPTTTAPPPTMTPTTNPPGQTPTVTGAPGSSSTQPPTEPFTSIPGIPGGCNPAHPGSCPSAYFHTYTQTNAPAPTGYISPNGTNGTTNGTYTASGGSGNGAKTTGGSVNLPTGAAVANVATGSLALLGGLIVALVL
ncbi:hypothetical protein DSL72_007956 [Monilinia vaccinii-corymbosi]|uniref:Yeast cell wall synthesis Kre9/Knh1-like N-terminal domain-containing protein n=1 Tax=Monilinia vaccinii-corymbosi TaxID=61207 RepID=A0A8A3PIJ0_9HELO|nr:hypothetical protein DSL72_007956 [Monilinia vaccinii-corymbosi]